MLVKLVREGLIIHWSQIRVLVDYFAFPKFFHSYSPAKAPALSIISFNEALMLHPNLVSSFRNYNYRQVSVWMDEEGRIVRLNEGTYAKPHMNGAFGSDDRVPIVRDWIAKGADSEFVWNDEKVKEIIFERTPEAERAQPTFRLGGYYFQQGNDKQDENYWIMAQELNPNSWNYFLQDLKYEEGGSAGPEWLARCDRIKGARGYYYAPLEIESN